MSNQGFHVAMRDAGIAVIETRWETSTCPRHAGRAYVLGGEQSGHIIMLEHATTGDGVLTSLQLLAAVNRHGVPLAAAAKMMPKYRRSSSTCRAMRRGSAADRRGDPPGRGELGGDGRSWSGRAAPSPRSG